MAPTTTTSSGAITLRPPSTHQPPNTPAVSGFAAPAGTWLAGTWHVTHSSLPLWRDKRNVNITYVNLPAGKVQDTTAYQGLAAGAKFKSLAGVNTPTPGVPAAFDWRGKGWLVVATSHWEILGYGDVLGGGGAAAAGDGKPAEDAWVVTYFSKTLFTPAGIDVYSRNKKGLPADTLEAITAKLAELQDSELKQLVGSMFQIKQDDEP